MTGPYFTGQSGGKHFYRGLAEVIRTQYPQVRGKQIFVQLCELGLFQEFSKGSTPYPLPYSFSDYEEKAA